MVRQLYWLFESTNPQRVFRYLMCFDRLHILRGRGEFCCFFLIASCVVGLCFTQLNSPFSKFQSVCLMYNTTSLLLANQKQIDNNFQRLAKKSHNNNAGITAG